MELKKGGINYTTLLIFTCFSEKVISGFFAY